MEDILTAYEEYKLCVGTTASKRNFAAGKEGKWWKVERDYVPDIPAGHFQWLQGLPGSSQLQFLQSVLQGASILELKRLATNQKTLNRMRAICYYFDTKKCSFFSVERDWTDVYEDKFPEDMITPYLRHILPSKKDGQAKVRDPPTVFSRFAKQENERIEDSNKRKKTNAPLVEVSEVGVYKYYFNSVVPKDLVQALRKWGAYFCCFLFGPFCYVLIVAPWCVCLP